LSRHVRCGSIVPIGNIPILPAAGARDIGGAGTGAEGGGGRGGGGGGGGGGVGGGGPVELKVEVEVEVEVEMEMRAKAMRIADSSVVQVSGGWRCSGGGSFC
jgi:hypothetical protein